MDWQHQASSLRDLEGDATGLTEARATHQNHHSNKSCPHTSPWSSWGGLLGWWRLGWPTLLGRAPRWPRHPIRQLSGFLYWNHNTTFNYLDLNEPTNKCTNECMNQRQHICQISSGFWQVKSEHGLLFVILWINQLLINQTCNLFILASPGYL